MPEQAPVTKTVTASDARHQLSQILNQVFRGETRVVVEEGGVPIAAIISPQEMQRFDRYEAERAERFNVLDTIGAAFVDVPEAELEEELSKALAEIRAEQQAKNRASATT